MNFYAKYLAVKRYWPTPKLLLVMKLTVLWMFLALTQVAASSFAQRISLNEKNTPLAKVLASIKKQSGYFFVYDNKEVGQIKVSVQVQGASVQQALDASLKDHQLTYMIVDKTVMIKKTSPPVIDRVMDFFSEVGVRGKVLDEFGEPLQGATVKVKDGTMSTMTDKNGEFYLKGVPEDAVIVIAYLGYKPFEVKAASSIGVIKMQLETSKLEEVKISGGYYETTDRLKTGSIVKVTAKDIERQPVTSLLMALQGRVPGLEITPQSGAAGAAPTIRIRGNNSLRQDEPGGLYANGNFPLYIIDGVPVVSQVLRSFSGSFTSGGYDPLSTIDPANIESIEVLKDGDATAIYGSRGANGVILITTKNGSKNGKGLNLDVNVYRGIGQVSKKLNLMKTEEYLAMRREAIINEGAAPGVYGMYDYDLIYWDTTRYTDWQDLLIGGTADVSNMQSSLTWGSKNTSFRFAGSHHKETMVTPGDFGYNRISGQLSLNHRSEDQRFSIALSSSVGIDNNRLFSDGGAIMEYAITLAPNAPKPFNEDGSLNWEVHKVGSREISTWKNPFAYLESRQNFKGLNMISNAILNYELFSGLTLSTSAGYTNQSGLEQNKGPMSAVPPEDKVYARGGSTKTETRSATWIVEPRLSFAKNFAAHRLNVLAGATMQETIGSTSIISASGYVSDVLLGSLAGAGSLQIFLDDARKYKYSSIYSRIGYSWKDQYILNLSARRDGSSRFGPGKKFGNFASIGAAWIFSEQQGIKDILPFGKLRASYGITGSDQIGDYSYLDLYSIHVSKYGTSTGLFPNALYNPDYAWESTEKIDVAIELGFAKNRVKAELNWYRNRSSNQLVQAPLPIMTGFNSVLSNFDATVQNTGWEFIVRGDILDSDTWKWNVSMNFSLPQNKLIKFDGIENSPYKDLYRVGEPLSIKWLYTYKGVNKETGLYEVEDKNGDGLVNNLDRSLINLTGKPFSGGLNNAIQYKKIAVNFLFQFAHQNGSRFNSNFPGGRNYNQISNAFPNRWRQSGDETTMQRFTNVDDNSYSRARSSNFNTVDASFIRLKTVSIDYLLPNQWLTKVKLRESKIFVQGQNIFTLTKYDALDPETGMGLPPLRMITAGLQFKF